MKEKTIPRYVQCVSPWQGRFSESIEGKIYDTSILPDFSELEWEDLVLFSRYFISYEPKEEQEQSKFML